MLIHLTIGYLLLQNTAALYLYDWKPMAGYTYTFEPVSPLIFAIKGDCNINLCAKIYLGDVAVLEFYSAQAIDICCKGTTPNNWYDCRPEILMVLTTVQKNTHGSYLRAEKYSWFLPPCRKILMVLTSVQKNTHGSYLRAEKYSWFLPPCRKILMVLTSVQKNTHGSYLRAVTNKSLS